MVAPSGTRHAYRACTLPVPARSQSTAAFMLSLCLGAITAALCADAGHIRIGHGDRTPGFPDKTAWTSRTFSRGAALASDFVAATRSVGPAEGR
ncbi:hypothetical protein MTDSW087_03458 [Methylobacterium dankookense]|uniref:Uncharacterized protein n=1 Tax=Methylobacterium dankookense TaxID=560405 RepID=A0A564G2B5_9HYPH|nr:hypothetical protein IFDJLNFL_1020 [Methylobacterium dankookense]VUF13751.1 hypothetical protein MTDSW087_03458 [Methylobacterium dankookense]